MASGFSYKPNRAAARKIMNSQGTQAVLNQKVQAVKAAADSMGSASYAGDVQPGKNRAHGIVYTPSLHAMRSNAKHNSLLKALNSGA